MPEPFESRCPVSEPLSPVEARLVARAKEAADRLLHEELAVIIAAHGYDPHDGRKYNICTSGRTLSLEVS